MTTSSGPTATLDDILITSELARRSARAPDHAAESRALGELAATMAKSPQDVFQKLADCALFLCRAGSAGVSMWEPGGAEVFRWCATSGDYAPYAGGTLPRHFSPCGTVLDRGVPLLMADPVRVFPYIAELCSPAREVLLVPFSRGGVAIGTVWVVAHDAVTHFDAEDARLVGSMTQFAEAAMLILSRIEAAERAEQTQRQREERLSALVRATSDVVYRMSADWQEMQPLDGRGLVASNSEPTRGWLETNIPSFEHARVRDAMGHAIAQKQVFELEHQVIGPGGSLGWTFSRAIPVLAADGAIVEWLGAASDITRRKQAEEGLRDISARMEAALSAGTIGTWSWDVHSDQFFGDASLARIFGVDASAIARGPLADILDAFHSEAREPVRALFAGLLGAEARHDTDFRVAGPQAGWRWVTARGQVERDSGGRPTRLSGVVIDITERKQAEAALTLVTAESERRKRLYETALSNTPDLVYVFDLEHRFTFANQALLSLWGKSWEQAIGKTCRELGYEEWHAAMHDREIDEVRATRRPVRGEVPFSGFVGSGRRVYDYIFVPVFGASGEVEAVAGTTRDVTERQNMEQELRQADRQKDDFIAVLAHELRNPLAPISTGLSLLGDPADETLRHKTLGVMRRQVDHMVRLIDDLLDVSRITRGKLTLRREVVSLARVVDLALEASQSNLQRGKHTLRLDLSAEDLQVDADQTRLAQIISNLLDNASKYTPHGGQITLATRSQAGEVTLSVSDNGLGIPADQLENVFTMFSQVNRALERAQGGLGIGLSLVRTLVAMHDGSVSAASDGLGSGSTFTVRLPRAHGAAVEPARTEPPPTSATAGTQILVVDDNEDAAELLKIALELEGYDATSAFDGPSAISSAERAVPHIVFLDIGLPGMSGYDVAQHLRRDVRFAGTVLIALTGWGTQEDRRKALASGFDIHLTKPVSARDLRTALTRASTLRPGAFHEPVS